MVLRGDTVAIQILNCVPRGIEQYRAGVVSCKFMDRELIAINVWNIKETRVGRIPLIQNHLVGINVAWKSVASVAELDSI
ncbi:hypothetical protein MA16_Dca017754 [Dendrobium catenatum]|uniref:Uncharacterized protein n=1 Tax=Dendrobium catenatum TaxID=906689 RepID=A0A2I0XIH4_9ASPA|nr:hypothetical protein MA16_Dca017754 [Dendrobium catenatum]